MLDVCGVNFGVPDSDAVQQGGDWRGNSNHWDISAYSFVIELLAAGADRGP